jgi:hypothetical protein
VERETGLGRERSRRHLRHPDPDGRKGHFTYLEDGTLLGRHVVEIANDTQAKVGGVALTSSQQSALSAVQAGIAVDYSIHDLHTTVDSAGQPVVTGQITDALGVAPPPVGLFTYQLSGTVVDSDGNPVVGAEVSTQTEDRDYWTVSTVTNSKGQYSSLFTASAEAAGVPGAPVPFTVRVSKNNVVYQFLPLEFVEFQRLKSATMNIQLPPPGYPMTLPLPHSYPGAVYQGVVVGVAQGDQAVRPVSHDLARQDGALLDHAAEEHGREDRLALGRPAPAVFQVAGRRWRSDRSAELPVGAAGRRPARSPDDHAEVASPAASSVRSRTPTPLAPLPR